MSLEETELIASAEAALHQAEDSEQIEEIEEETECSSGTHLEVTSTVTAQMSQTSSTTVPAPASATPTLQKIAPKPAIVKQAAVAAGSKIVYLKSPNGTPQPIRIGGQLLGQNATAAAANSTNAPGSATSPAIQFIKTLDGNFLQIKNKNVVSVQKTIAPTPTTPVVAGNSTASSANNTRFVVKSGNGSRLILATPPTAIASKSTTNATAGAATTTSGGNTRTLTVSQAQQVGLISSAKLKELVAAATAKMSGSATANKPAAIAPATVAGTATIASVNAAKGPPTILNKGVKSWQSQKILLQSKSGTSNNTTATTSSTTTTAAAATTLSAPTEVKMAKPIGQNVVKISQTSHLRAVNVAGKGLQYVRVLNSSGSGSSPAIASSSTTVVRQSVTNGRQQPVFVQRKILPNTQASTSGESSVTPKPQFITKKLEVTPVASTTAPVANRIAIARSKPNPPTLSKSTAILLNNTQKPVVNTPIDIKPASGHSQSFEITTVPKNEPLSPSQKTASIRTIRDKRSSTPDPLSSTLYYSTLKLPSPEPAEGKWIEHRIAFAQKITKSNSHFCSQSKSKALQLHQIPMPEIVLRLLRQRGILSKLQLQRVLQHSREGRRTPKSNKNLPRTKPTCI